MKFKMDGVRIIPFDSVELHIELVCSKKTERLFLLLVMLGVGQ